MTKTRLEFADPANPCMTTTFQCAVITFVCVERIRFIVCVQCLPTVKCVTISVIFRRALTLSV